MSKPELDIVVSEIVKNGVARAVITGGEPILVKSQSFYLAQELRAAGVPYSFNTNATLVTPEIATTLTTLLFKCCRKTSDT